MDNVSGLYRAEAVDAVTSRLGSPAKFFGVKSWAIVAFIGALAASAVTFVAVAKYSRKETVVGLVTPSGGVERISALRAGVIKQVLVKSGDPISVRQPIFLLSYDAVLEGGGNLSDRLEEISQAQLRSAELQGQFKKQQLYQSRLETEAQIQGLEDDIVRLSEQAALQRDRVALLEKDYNAAKTLIEKQYISEVQLAQKHDALLQSRQSLLQVEQGIGQSTSQIARLRTQLKSAGMAVSEAEAGVALNRSQYAEKLLNNQSLDGAQIVAQREGYVTNIQARVGDVVASGQTLALVVPSNKIHKQEVNLWVPSRAVGFVHAGTKVRLMFDAFPYQTFGIGSGKVIEVSTAPLMPNELPVPIKTEEQMYKIVVALDRDALTAYGRDWPLMPGMRLTADLVLEEKSFLDWLLDPLMATRRRAGG